ncbi:MAG: hypothetical protein Q8L34_02895 [Candidatus Woesearchaeota archaeon]|nr:hypothetical protein [Candidatus Woesearchaeota archaeon]
MVKKEEVIWVFPGGGNQTAYACGVCLALIKLKVDPPKFIVSSSGGTANAFYYLSEQIKRAEQIWTREISTKKILNFWRFWKMFNRDAMVDGVFMKEPNSLKLNKVKTSPLKVFVAVTNKNSGIITFFSNKDNINLLHLLKATMTVPFFSGIFRDYSVTLKGKKYLDSRVTARYELLVQEAIKKGAKKVIVLGGNRSWSYRYFGNFLNNLWVLTKNEAFRKNQKVLERKQRNFKIPSAVQILYLCPKKRLKMAPWDNEKWQLKAAVDQGYKDTLNCAKKIYKLYN